MAKEQLKYDLSFIVTAHNCGAVRYHRALGVRLAGYQCSLHFTGAVGAHSYFMEILPDS